MEGANTYIFTVGALSNVHPDNPTSKYYRQTNDIKSIAAPLKGASVKGIVYLRPKPSVEDTNFEQVDHPELVDLEQGVPMLENAVSYLTIEFCETSRRIRGILTDGRKGVEGGAKVFDKVLGQAATVAGSA